MVYFGEVYYVLIDLQDELKLSLSILLLIFEKLMEILSIFSA